LAAVENIFPPVPADTAVAFGAFLSVGGRVSAAMVFAVTWGSNVATSVVVYVAARRYGRPFFRGRIGKRLVNPRVMASLERAYDRYGGWVIFVSRFVPAVRAVVAPFAGLADLGAVRTVVPLVVASGIWYGTLTFVAATLVREIDQIARLVSDINRGGGVLAVVVVAAAIFWWQRRKHRRPGRPGPYE
jgi:membrane protein DedA with SNARE-associated domain